MTEKRFEMVITGADGSFHYLDKNTGEKITSTLELENKLNELHEENIELKQEMGDLGTAHAEEINKIEDEFYEEILKWEKKNEQLKTTIQQLTNDNTKQKKKLNTAMKENEELKSLIKALSNADFINQIKRAYDENLSVKELADNCGVDLE